MNTMNDKQELIVPPSLPSLFFSFLRLGSVSFGGAAIVAYVRKMVVEEKKWLPEKTFFSGMTLCQIIPGAIVMQLSAYVGLKTRGIPGAMVSFIGYGFPAFLFMIVLSILYKINHDLPAVISGFKGLQIIVIAIIASATLSIGKSYLKNWKDIIIAIFAAILYGLRINPVYVIVFTAIAGIILYYKDPLEQMETLSEDKSFSIKNFVPLLSFLLILFISLLFLHPRLFELSILMAKFDLFAFGGGFTSVPLMLHEIVTVHSWMDEATFMNGIAMGQITPGPVVITATFVGYMLYGILGGIIATISVFTPSFLIVTVIEPYFNIIRKSFYVSKALKGIFSSFTGFLFTTTILFALNIPWDIPRVLLVIAAFIALLYKVQIYWVVPIGAIISILIF